MKKILFVMMFVVVLGACTPSAPTPTQIVDPLTPLERARVVLTAYLDELNVGLYERAAIDFGGDVEILTAYNPDINAQDVPALLQAACERNGFQCLPMRAILSEEVLSETEFRFIVQFVDQNGGIFEIGACCGEDPQNVDPVSEFEFVVKRQGEVYRVITLPPYIP